MKHRLNVSVMPIIMSIVFITILGSADAAAGWMIDFENHPGGPFLNGEVVRTQMAGQILGAPPGLGVVIYGDNFNNDPDCTDPSSIGPRDFPANLPNCLNQQTDLAVIFDSTQPSQPAPFDDDDLLQPFTSTDPISIPPGGTDPSDPYNPGNILIIQDDTTIAGICAPGALPTSCIVTDDEGNTQPLIPGPPLSGGGAGQFVFIFSQPVFIQSMDVFDVEPGENQPIDVIFFDENNNEIPIIGTILTTGGDNMWRRVPLNVVGVKTMVAEMAGSGAIDNIQGQILVGGTILPIDNTSLLVAGITTINFPIIILASLGTIVGLVTFRTIKSHTKISSLQ